MRLQDKKTRTLALCGIFTALALACNILEFLIPLQAFVHVPGVKLGLANVVSVYVLYYIGEKEAFSVTVCRCVIASLIFGSVTSFAFSLCGGLLSLASSVLLKRTAKSRVSFIGVCVIGAACHNFGQIAVCCAMFGTLAVVRYLPFLLLSSVICGGIIGGILCFLHDITKRKS